MNTLTRFQMADLDYVQWMPDIRALSIYGATAATVYLAASHVPKVRDVLAALVEPVAFVEGGVPRDVYQRGTSLCMYPTEGARIHASRRTYDWQSDALTLFIHDQDNANGGFNVGMSDEAAGRLLGLIGSNSYLTIHSAPRPATVSSRLDRLVYRWRT